MRRSTVVLFVAVLICVGFLPQSVAAQETGKFFIQGGAFYTVPTEDFARTDGTISQLPTTGFAGGDIGYGVRGLFQISPQFSIFAEYYRPRFNVDEEAVLENITIPGIYDYDAEYDVKAMGVGVRFSPIQLAMTAPYLQIGMSRYDMAIVQYLSEFDISEELDTSNNFNFGAGVMIAVGSFALDAGARYHSVDLKIDGQPMDYRGTWWEVGITLAYKLSG